MKSDTEMDANRIERELEDAIKERDRVRQLLNDESQLRRQSQDTMREMDAALTRETNRAKDAEQRARELEYANRDLVKERDLLASDCELVRSELAAVMAERDELVKQGRVPLERLRAFKVPEPADTIESVASAIYEEALADGCTHGRTAEYFADVLRKEIEDETGPRLQWATWRCRDRIVALVTRLRAEPKPVWKCDSCGFECFGGHTDHCTNDPYCCPVHHVRPDGSCNRKDSACIASEERCNSDASRGDAESGCTKMSPSTGAPGSSVTNVATAANTGNTIDTDTISDLKKELAAVRADRDDKATSCDHLLRRAEKAERELDAIHAKIANERRMATLRRDTATREEAAWAWAAVISAIDRIDSSNDTVDTIESIAEAMAKSWEAQYGSNGDTVKHVTGWILAKINDESELPFSDKSHAWGEVGSRANAFIIRLRAERRANACGLGRERYLAEIDRLVAERDRLRADFEAAAGELLIPVPEPGTDIARLMIANRMCVRMHDRLHSDNKRLRRHKRKLQAKLAKERDLVKKTLEALGECYGAAFERRTAKELEHRILRAWQSVYPDQSGGVAAYDQKTSSKRGMRVELHRRIVAGRDEIITKRTAERDRMREALERIGTECLMYCGRTCVEAQPTKPCPGCIARVAIGNKR